MKHVVGILVGFCIATTMPTFAQATFTLFPIIFEVTGVAKNDVLNVRDAPDANAYDLGDVAPGGQVEVTAYDTTGKWARVLWGGEDGWVARRFLKPVDVYGDSNSGMPVDIICGGTEPFWSFAIRDGSATFTEMGGDAEFETIDYSVMSSNMYRTNYAFETPRFTGFVRRAECSDGMSDATYGWALDLLENAGSAGQLRSGCCATILPVVN